MPRSPQAWTFALLSMHGQSKGEAYRYQGCSCKGVTVCRPGAMAWQAFTSTHTGKFAGLLQIGRSFTCGHISAHHKHHRQGGFVKVFLGPYSQASTVTYHMCYQHGQRQYPS